MEIPLEMLNTSDIHTLNLKSFEWHRYMSMLHVSQFTGYEFADQHNHCNAVECRYSTVIVSLTICYLL